MPSVKHRLFGKLAEATGFVSSEQLDEALEKQEEARMKGKEVPKIGQILEQKGYLTESQIQSILKTARNMGGRRFGEIAINLNLLTLDQLNTAKRIQEQLTYPDRDIDLSPPAQSVYQSFQNQEKEGDAVPQLGEILVELGYLTEEQVQVILDQSNKEVCTCPRCNSRLNVTNQPIGHTMVCPECSSYLEVAGGKNNNKTLNLLERTGGTKDLNVDDLEGVETDQHRFKRKLGTDSMGVTYEGERKSDQKKFALKALFPKRIEDSEIMSYLGESAEKMSRFSHPAIRTVHSLVEFQNIQFLILEWVEGCSLRNVIEEVDRFEYEHALFITEEVISGLKQAAQFDLYHGDLRPSNILLDDQDNVKISGLGLSPEPSENLLMITESGDVAPFYIAPELILDDRMVNIQTDIFSLGACMYHMVTGRPPFEGSSPYKVIRTALEEGVRYPHLVNPDLPSALSRLIIRMLEVEPEDRFQSYEELEEALDNPDILKSPSRRGLAGLTKNVPSGMRGPF